MVATATRTILESLDRLPNRDDRTKIAIICFDVSLHFFSISVGFCYLFGMGISCLTVARAAGLH
jgi:Sec23/Sec24 trunk domain